MKIYELKYCADLFEESYVTIGIYYNYINAEYELNRLKAIKIGQWTSLVDHQRSQPDFEEEDLLSFGSYAGDWKIVESKVLDKIMIY